MRINREHTVGVEMANLVDLGSMGICKTILSDV